MTACIIFAKPSVINGIFGSTYHVATMWRKKEKYKILAVCGLNQNTIIVQGGGKPSGFEPFCQKWANRWANWIGKISFGHDWTWSGGSEGCIMDSLTAEMSPYFDRHTVEIGWDSDILDQQRVLRSLSRGFLNSCYGQDLVKLSLRLRLNNGIYRTSRLK